MRYFLKSKRFKIILVVALLLITSVIISSIFVSKSAFQSDFISSILTPVQKLTTNISRNVGSFFDNFKNVQIYKNEINELKEKIAQNDKKIVDFENIKRQNEFFKEFLDIKEQNADYKFQPATLIARDTTEPFSTFTIDKGTLDGVSVHDPVINSNGLIGFISDAYSNQSTVVTVINPNINISAIDNRTRDSGNVTGDIKFAKDKLGQMKYISNKNTIAPGDFLVTSGSGGIFPEGLIIGTVKSVHATPSAISSYAIFEPIVDFSAITDVMVITDFSGKKPLGE